MRGRSLFARRRCVPFRARREPGSADRTSRPRGRATGSWDRARTPMCRRATAKTPVEAAGEDKRVSRLRLRGRGERARMSEAISQACAKAKVRSGRARHNLSRCKSCSENSHLYVPGCERQESPRSVSPGPSGFRGGGAGGAEWFGWARGGGSNGVLLTTDVGFAEVVITVDRAYVLTDQIEAERLRAE